jgi:DMSO/TMAO reductase YedYZ molybdopterin-dependent catalytic subunit
MSPNAGRTINGIPRLAQAQAANPKLRVEGLVENPVVLAPADLHDLPHVPYLHKRDETADHLIPATDWAGVRLSDVVALATPSSEARYVRVCSGPYAFPVSLADATHALLCDRLANEPLAVDQGGPWRLVVPGTRYFQSVKWVDRLELTAEAPDNSADRIAQARARARAAKAAKS